MLANNITPSTIQITKKMQTDYKCAWTKYEIYLEQEKKKKSKIENDNQKSIISKEINGVKTVIIEKEKNCEFLEKESFLAMQDAEKKNDMSFVKRANSLKRSRDETDNEIKTLQKTLVFLEEKRLRCKTYNLDVFFLDVFSFQCLNTSFFIYKNFSISSQLPKSLKGL